MSLPKREHGIHYVQDGHIARVTLDRPEVLNALDPAAERHLGRIWDHVQADENTRVVVLTGAGDRSFCTGADMSAESIAKTGLEYWAELDGTGFGGLPLRDLDVPVIARVNGYALGGGMELVLGCDLVVAAEHAQFGLTEPRVGRMPMGGGIIRLTRSLPYTQAMALLLTGRRAFATELRDLGLVNEVVPAGDLDTAVDGWVQQILACAPTAVRAIKQIVRATAHLSAHDAYAARLPALMAALNSEDAVEGVRAFQEKRAPVWPGR